MRIDKDLTTMSEPELAHLKDKIKSMPCIICGSPGCNFREITLGADAAFVRVCQQHLSIGFDALKAALQIEMATIDTVPSGLKTLEDKSA